MLDLPMDFLCFDKIVRDCFIEVIVLGLRDVEAPFGSPIQNLFLEFDIGERGGHGNKVYRTQPSNRPW